MQTLIRTRITHKETYHRSSDLRSPLVTKINRQTSRFWLRIAVLMVLDSLALSLAWFLAEQFGTPIAQRQTLLNSQSNLELLLPILVVNLGTLAASGFYGTDDKRRSYARLPASISLAQIILLTTVFLYQPTVVVSRTVFLWAWLLALILVSVQRFMLEATIINLRRHHIALKPSVFLLGNPEDLDKAKQLLERTQQFQISGCADLSVRNHPYKWSRTLEYIRHNQVSEVFICSWSSIKNQIVFFWELKSAGIQLRVLPMSLELPQHWSEIKMIGELTTIRFSSSAIIGVDFWLKRSLDLVGASLMLVLLSLPMLLISILIRLDSPGPVFYKQTRIGLKNREFQVWKFRTMVQNASQLQSQLEARNEVRGGVLFKIKDDPRITKVGKFLRRYSLDELPQLINVLQGEMSLVGPRPLPKRDVERFSESDYLRHEVLPGITGLWQVSGRSDVDSEQVFALDFAYIRHWSLALDFKILLQTIKVVLFKEGAY
ncbi:MAG: sugar transferase [Symploca sp. SIO3C6]|uniref:Sugar transferase n=1 Tax=Symploca sp. SIO1C4 TaxID=2607765 RepID=A0A6B3NCI7_9CYAN|nr:sugar transferase [Symploca sp. SIO3C6]NER29263.1 sugar transferase [Symploca sp. SIO1C4]NET04149.1 sugar transferase [Symploca sp. SIO2B6]